MSHCGWQPGKQVVEDRFQLEERIWEGGSAETPSGVTGIASSGCGKQGKPTLLLVLQGSLP